jgi:hypothetical protein
MTKSTFPQKNVFSGLKIDWVKLSELFPTLKTSKSNFPSFIQHKKWQSHIFRIIFNGGKRCGKLDFVIFDGGKVWKIVCNILWLE